LKQIDTLSTILFNLSFQKVIQSLKMVPSHIKIGEKHLTVLTYADDIVLIGKHVTYIRKRFCRNRKTLPES